MWTEQEIIKPEGNKKTMVAQTFYLIKDNTISPY